MAVEVNQEAPDCTLTSLGGTEQVTLNQLRGKVVYADFWASWCPPCRKSFPFLNKLSHDFSDQGLEIVGINVDERLSDAKEFLAQTPANFNIVIDPDQQCAAAFDLRGMPSSYLIDRNGVIRHIHVGFRSGDTEELQAWVQKVLAEKSN